MPLKLAHLALATILATASVVGTTQKGIANLFSPDLEA